MTVSHAMPVRPAASQAEAPRRDGAPTDGADFASALRRVLEPQAPAEGRGQAEGSNPPDGGDTATVVGTTASGDPLIVSQLVAPVEATNPESTGGTTTMDGRTPTGLPSALAAAGGTEQPAAAGAVLPAMAGGTAAPVTAPAVPGSGTADIAAPNAESGPATTGRAVERTPSLPTTAGATTTPPGPSTAAPTGTAALPVHGGRLAAVAETTTAPDSVASAGTTATASVGASGQTATAPAAPAAAPTGSAVTGQVFPHVTNLVSRGDGRHSITLRLHPADLGEVQVTVTVKNGVVDVTMAAGAEARQALRSGSAELRSLLELAGAATGTVVIRELPGTSTATTSGALAPSAHDAGAGSFADPDARSSADDDGHRDSGDRARDGTTRGGVRPDQPRRDADPVPTLRAAGTPTALDLTI